MKSVLCLTMFAFLVGCLQAPAGSSDVAPSIAAPSDQVPGDETPAVTLSGMYSYMLKAAADPSCPWCLDSCELGSDGLWVCEYVSHLPPVACTMSLLGSIEISEDMSSAYLWDMVLLGVGPQHGNPDYQWQENDQQQISISESKIDFANQGVSLGFYIVDDSHVILDFGQGCALQFERTGP